MRDDQLLTASTVGRVTADITDTFPVRVPTGRGKVHSLSWYFIGEDFELKNVFINILVNGNLLVKNYPALFGRLSRDPDRPWVGSSRIARVLVDIPEASVITVETVAGSIGDVTLIFNGYFTSNFIIQSQARFTYQQYFQFTHLDNSSKTLKDVLPTARGRIVGITPMPNIDPVSLSAQTEADATLSINGKSILEGYSPFQYMFQQQSILTNNFMVNIAGGSVIESRFNNQSGQDQNIGYMIYFDETIDYKPNVDTSKSQPLSR